MAFLSLLSLLRNDILQFEDLISEHLHKLSSHILFFAFLMLEYLCDFVYSGLQCHQTVLK